MTRRGPSNAASPSLPRAAGTRDTPLPAQCGLARCPRSRPMPVRHGVRALRPNARNTLQRASMNSRSPITTSASGGLLLRSAHAELRCQVCVCQPQGSVRLFSARVFPPCEGRPDDRQANGQGGG